ncbi:phage tail tube protein [Fuchsiella alkaliacetigena]|uniref:phage tail tube protein n=1 Tax=Fuchsiella alkaliacetigena TaxID=957042 RepID=UPI00200AB1F4|nr:phage tail tube protein [Fuchsiella alkaliacetigena]MCK8824733.1 phage tail tube protein [Fuchsiella alkaliacetigena]
MGTGRNARMMVGIQEEKGQEAQELKRYMPRSITMETQTESAESEALTGNRFVEDEMTSAIYCDGDSNLEVNIESFPDLLKLAGFEENSEPNNFQTEVVESEDNTENTIKVEATYGLKAGDSIDIDIDTATIDSVDHETKLVKLDEPLEEAPSAGDAVVNNDRYAHVFKTALTIDYWATLIRDMRDEDMYSIFKDCKINSLNLNATSQAYLTLDVTWNGIKGDEVEDQAPEDDYTVDNLTGPKMVATDIDLLIDEEDATDIVDDFTTAVNNNLDTEDFGLNRTKQRRTLDVEEGEINLDFTAQFDRQMYLDLKEKEKENIYTEVEAQFDEGLAIEYPRVKVNSVEAPVDGPGKVTTSFNGNALFDQTEETPMIVTVVDENDQKY